MPAGVPPLPPLFIDWPPPQPDEQVPTARQSTASPKSTRLRRFREQPTHIPTNAKPGRPESAGHIASLLPEVGSTSNGLVRLAEFPAVVTATWTVVEFEPLRLTELVDSKQVDPAGAPLQLSATE